jgi:DNA-directed RNA polymerase specialized sigma24 family protein
VSEVRRAVSELPGEQQEVVRLQHFEGLAYEEMAAHCQAAATSEHKPLGKSGKGCVPFPLLRR